jgi:hypothetical protein
MRWAAAMMGLAGLGWAASACGPALGFACSTDQQCQAGAVEGACQVNGYCSFPDEACPSGHRFGDAAPPDVANVCVEPSEGTSTSTGTDSTGASANDEFAGDDKPDWPALDTSDDGSSATTVALDDDGTSTGPMATTGMDSGSDDPTTGGAQACRSIVDEFEGTEIGAMWGQDVAADTSVGVAGGQLEVTVGPDPVWRQAGISMDLGPMTGGWARLLITELDQPELSMAPGITLSGGICEVQLQLSEGSIWAINWNNEAFMATVLAAEPLPPLPLWLQLRQLETGEVVFEWSTDESTWNELAIGPLPDCGDFSVPLMVGVRSGGQIDEGSVTRTFDRFEACVPE